MPGVTLHCQNNTAKLIYCLRNCSRTHSLLAILEPEQEKAKTVQKLCNSDVFRDV
jgi:hypothetical protein